LHRAIGQLRLSSIRDFRREFAARRRRMTPARPHPLHGCPNTYNGRPGAQQICHCGNVFFSSCPARTLFFRAPTSTARRSDGRGGTIRSPRRCPTPTVSLLGYVRKHVAMYSDRDSSQDRRATARVLLSGNGGDTPRGARTIAGGPVRVHARSVQVSDTQRQSRGRMCSRLCARRSAPVARRTTVNAAQPFPAITAGDLAARTAARRSASSPL